MDAQNLQSLIRSKLDSFPKKTRRVAEYLLANPSDAAFHSITETAEKLAVSKAQLVRVARMLGFDGYASLKEVMKRSMLEKVAPLTAAEEEQDDDIPQSLLRLEHANIEETLQNMPAGSIVKFCQAVKSAATIYCMAWGISALVIEWFYTRFTELGLKTVLIRRGSVSLLEQSRAIGKTDMMIVCELPSYVIEVTEAVKKAHDRGAFITALTDSPAAPICSYADLQFYVGDVSPTFGSSLIGPMFAVHVLTSVLSFHLGKEGQAALAAQKEGLSDERVYYPAYGLRY